MKKNITDSFYFLRRDKNNLKEENFAILLNAWFSPHYNIWWVKPVRVWQLLIQFHLLPFYCAKKIM